MYINVLNISFLTYLVWKHGNTSSGMPSVQQLVVDESIDAWNQGQLPPWRGVWSSANWETQNLRRDFPLTCVTVHFCHLTDSLVVVVEQKISVLQRAVCKELQVFNPGATTSKTTFFKASTWCTSNCLASLNFACCSAQSVPYWKLKWQTGWGKGIFSSLYLVRPVHTTMSMCQPCCHLDLKQLPQVCSTGSKWLVT